MDNITIRENPYIEGKSKNDGLFKIAKMSNKEETPKIQTLKARWEKELASLAKNNFSSPSAVDKNNSLMDRLGLLNKDYYNDTKTVGARKLKVNSIVADKSKKFYGIHDAVVVEKKEIVVPHKEENQNVDFVHEEIKHEEPIQDTRMSRLERTGEIPTNTVLNQEMKRTTPEINDIINTPTRFERHIETPFDDLINDNNINTRVEKNINEQVRQTETKGGDPNLYTKLIHGKEEVDISVRLQDAKSKLYTANEEKEKAKAVNASLAADVENVRREIEKIKREKKEKEERELSNTLNMLQAAKEEILGETRKYDNLQEELAELIRQRDNLLGNQSFDDDSYSRRKNA